MKVKVSYYADTTKPLVIYSYLAPGETCTDYSKGDGVITGDPDYGTYIVTTFFYDGGVSQVEQQAKNVVVSDLDLTFDVNL